MEVRFSSDSIKEPTLMFFAVLLILLAMASNHVAFYSSIDLYVTAAKTLLISFSIGLVHAWWF